MKISIEKASPIFSADLVILGVFKDENNSKNTKSSKLKNKHLLEIDKQLSHKLINEAQNEGFLGNEGQTFTTSTLGQSKFSSISLLGLGDIKEQSIDLFRRFGADALKIAQKKQSKSLFILLPSFLNIPLFDVISSLSEGCYLANYRFDRYITKDKKTNIEPEITILIDENPIKEYSIALERGKIIAHAVIKARDLINEGPSLLTPVNLAKTAMELSHDNNIKCDILDEKKLQKEKMLLMLAVANASKHSVPPRLIKLHYKPNKASKHKIVLIGKGVTFDSGGLDIKTAEGMLDMKVDMSGAACVLGVLSSLAKLKAKVEVVGYMACVENGIGPEAYHPGDIIISRKGISVEITNTDAEGRLVLADTMTYAIDHDKPSVIIDVATLTGACMIALGPKTAGLFSNSDSLANKIIASGKNAGEEFWRLPLNMGLKESLKSTIADIKNCGDRYGGAITAALFLAEFIDKDIDWAHLDIAGPATNNKPHPYIAMGGVGFGIRTLIDYLMEL